MTTDRIKNINKMIDEIVSEKDWNYDFNIRFDFLINKYKKQLDTFNFVSNSKIDLLKPGGYIKYINNNDFLIWAGILYKIDTYNIYTIKDNEIIKINKSNNLIFYKKHITLEDKRRDIFISSLDKYG